MQDTNVNDFKRVVVVSNRLPFKSIVEHGETRIVQSSGGLISAVLALSEKTNPVNTLPHTKIQWFGFTDTQNALALESYSTKLPFDLHPVVIDPSVNDGFYEGFCNDFLWPLFHYFNTYTIFRESYFEKYSIANNIMADAVCSLTEPGDCLWIHDYHFLFLPELIRKKMPQVSIGFFLHIPFPSYEIFRLVPKQWREALIRGLLGADLIGFHTNDYMQYFLDSVRKILGYEHDLGVINTAERLVKVDFFPIGIDYEKFHTAAQSEEVHREIDLLQHQLPNTKIIFSVDRLDYTKGLHDRLVGFEYFLECNPKWIGNVIFIMVVVPSRDTILQYKEMKKQIEATIGRINGKFSTLTWRPIVYQYKSLSFVELVSLYSLSDVGLITPIRDGMNLVAKEYVACQTINAGVLGILILSEMAGAASEMAEAFIINPTDRQAVAEAIQRCLEMPLPEREQRIARMQKRLKDYDVFTWAQDFFTQLKAIKKAQKVFNVNLLTPSIIQTMSLEYHQSQSRILFLDYDGTLVPFTRYPEEAIPNEEVFTLLNSLCKDTANTVVIVSGRDKSFLEKWFGTFPIHIIAEHGAFVKYPLEQWKCVNDDAQNKEWKKVFFPILDKYTDRCSGSFLEEKSNSYAWHYRNVDPEIASLRSHELKEELSRLLSQYKYLQVLMGNKVLEIKMAGYSKGSVASTYLKSSEPTFIIAIGDDITDEDLFFAMPSNAYTIKVGVAPSIARYNLIHQDDVLKLFQQLQTQD